MNSIGWLCFDSCNQRIEQLVSFPCEQPADGKLSLRAIHRSERTSILRRRFHDESSVLDAHSPQLSACLSRHQEENCSSVRQSIDTEMEKLEKDIAQLKRKYNKKLSHLQDLKKGTRKNIAVR